jgi:exonuclease V gamma subunit
MNAEIFFSYRMDALVDLLQLDQRGLLDVRTILVPNSQMRQWLLLEIAKKKGIAMGLKILEVDQWVPPSVNSTELFCLIYKELEVCEDPDLKAYLDGKKKRLLDLTEQLVSLFFVYGRFGKELFEGTPKGWQQTILHKLFVQGPWRLPVQMEIKPEEPLICFGIDTLAPVYWSFLFAAPKLSIYLFSPCVEFWEDICSDRERKSLGRYWKKRGAGKAGRDQLDQYLREGPRTLANWGKMGRETLKILNQYDFEAQEVYPSLKPDSQLKRFQTELLTFEEHQKGEKDGSVHLFLTSSSRLREVEVLRDEILKLNIPYAEIAVLAPDIEPYVPLIQYVFGDEIPYRISGFDTAPQSHFRQGLIRLLNLSIGRWDAEEVLALFETPSFYRKRGWDQEKLQTFREWVSAVRIQWGRSSEHRKEILENTFGTPVVDHGSWEKGLDALLNAIIYLQPLNVNADLFEELIGTVFQLEQSRFTGEKTLSVWADELERAASEFLFADAEDEATVSAFHHLLADFRKFPNECRFPFEVILRFINRPCAGQMHGSHLHAVSCANLEEGALLPATAVFMIGMDEESFPRRNHLSSLDLLNDGHRRDLDRYLFLQTLFSAKEFLRISYGHLSADEGKLVSPSLLVQELLSAIDVETTVCQPHSKKPEAKKFVWPKKGEKHLPEGEVVVPISELRQLARHPWKFFLQKVHGMYLNEELEDSFGLQKGQLVRATLEKPVDQVLAGARLPAGSLGEALSLDVVEKAAEWQEQLSEWGLKPFSLLVCEPCTEAHWDGAQYVVPPIVLSWDRLKVRLVGEVKYATMQGIICANEDNVSGLLKIWPEALIVALALEAPQIWMLRNGKTKQLGSVEASLKSFVEYYFHCLNTASPLLPEWSDALLRKGVEELEKKIEKGTTFEDPVIDWVFARAELPKAEEICADWGSSLKETFCELSQLYPTRGKSHATI